MLMGKFQIQNKNLYFLFLNFMNLVLNSEHIPKVISSMWLRDASVLLMAQKHSSGIVPMSTACTKTNSFL